MNRHVSANTLVLTLIGLLTAAYPATAAKPVPFKGSIRGDVTVTPLDPPFGFVLIEGGGNATKLGRYTVTIPHIVNFATATGEGQYLFTAANGDTLSADFTGFAVPTENGFHIVETATITGGTGRFAGATGSFTCEREFDTTTLTTVGSFEGTISK
jgi:hypothetical protein